MIVYYILFFITVAFSKAVEKSGKAVKLPSQEEEENRAAFIAAMLAFLPTIIFMGLRGRGIGDTQNYIDTYISLNPQGLTDSIAERNPGYSIFENFFKLYITDNPNVFLLCLTALAVGLMLRTQSRYSPMFALSAYVFYGSTEISYVFNGERQYFAMVVMFFSLKYVEEKKLIKYIICCIIAFSIHQTSIIVIPAYLIARGKFLNIKIIGTGLATIVATAFSSLFIDYINDMFISDSVYSQYYTTLVEADGVNIFRVLVAGIPFALCLVYKKRIDELDDQVLNYCANMSTLALAVSVFAATSGGELLGRLAEYYLIFNTLTYPMLLKRVVSKNVRLVLEIGLIIGYFFFFFYQFTVVWEMGYVSEVLGISIGMEAV